MTFKDTFRERYPRLARVLGMEEKKKPAPEPIRQEESKTLAQLLETGTLTGFQAVSIFRNSPTNDSKTERILGMYLIKAYREKTPLAETGITVPEGQLARAYIDEMARTQAKPEIARLFVPDAKDPTILKLGPELVEFVKQRAAQYGVTIN